LIHIMLVEDHALFRDSLAFLLGQEPDLEVTVEAGSLAEAREALGDKFDVAIIDLALPDGEGSQLIGEVRLAKPGVSVLVLSATVESERSEEVERGRADAVLSKAVTVQRISDEVRRLAGR
jgi:DNA-binding NarL/FixJ family response regulator